MAQTEPAGLPVTMPVLTTGPVTMPTAEVESVPADLHTPRGTLKVFAAAVAAGNAQVVRDCLDAQNPTESRLADAIAATAVSAAELRKAAATRFGEPGRKAFASIHSLGEQMRVVDGAAEQIEGDRATVRIASDGQPVEVRLVKRGDAWKLEVAPLLGGADPQHIWRLLPTMKAFAAAFDQTAAGIARDQYTSPEAAAAALRERLLDAARIEPDRAATQPATHPTTAPLR